MMNGRQRSPRGMSTHESGSTIMKKIAKVAVGKSTRRGRYSARAGVDRVDAQDARPESRTRITVSSRTGLTGVRGVRRGRYRAPVSRLAAIGVAALASLAAAAAHASPGAKLHATFVGDSVSASIGYVPAARSQLRRGLRVTLDLEVCRRLVAPSCSHRGSTPPSALAAVQAYGRRLGDVLIVNVGYNDSPAGYATGIDRVMRTAVAQGVRRVVWVTLRETSPGYRRTNAAIERAAKRWPQLVVADWDAYSRGKAWFGRDGLHLTPSGAAALASFVRPYVVSR